MSLSTIAWLPTGYTCHVRKSFVNSTRIRNPTPRIALSVGWFVRPWQNFSARYLGNEKSCRRSAGVKTTGFSRAFWILQKNQILDFWISGFLDFWISGFFSDFLTTFFGFVDNFFWFVDNCFFLFVDNFFFLSTSFLLDLLNLFLICWQFFLDLSAIF